MKGNFHYYAFISYNSADEKWAKWLHSHLEYYKIPNALYKEYPDMPKRIRPVFWYKEDLSGTTLKKHLQQELESSKYLIVICSPDSANSEWVNDEVKTFINQGKINKIIPFVVDGEVHSHNKENECLPPALRKLPHEKEIRAIDVRNDKGKNHALIDVISTMLGIRFDSLWQRHERRRKKIRNLWIAAISIVIMLSLGIYEYKREKIEYYAEYADCWGLAKGIRKLDEETRSHRSKSYKFTYRRTPIGEKNALSWRLSEISMVNSKGTIIDNFSRDLLSQYSIYRYFYSAETGLLNEIHICDALGKVLFKQKVSSNGTTAASIYDLKGISDESPSGYLNAYTMFSLSSNTMTPNQKSNIKRIVYRRNEKGYITGATFHSNNSDDLSESIIADANGAYGHEYKVDSIGRFIETKILDKDGNAINGINGVSIIKVDFINDSTVINTNYDKDNKPISDNKLICRTVYKLDVYGNTCYEEYYGVDLKRIYSIDGISGQKAEYDSDGTCIKITFLNAQDKPITDVNGINHMLYEYDSKGRNKEVSFRDISGYLHYNKDGIALIKMKFHENTICAEYIEYYGIDFNLTKNNMGISALERKFDDNNNIISECFYDTDLRRTKCSYSFSRNDFKYDNYNVIERRFYDENDKPCYDINGTNGYCLEYNLQGNISKHIWVDLDGTPINNKNDDIAIIKSSYDKHGNITERSFFNKDNKRAINKLSKVHKEKYFYNKFGGISITESYGLNDSLCINNGGFSIIKNETDSTGNIIKITYYDENRQACNNAYGINKIEIKYNKHHNQTFYAYYNLEGNLVEDNKGIAKYISTYNIQGKNTSYSMFDKHNRLHKNELGFARIECEYDKLGLLTKRDLKDENGKLSSDNSYGYARQIFEYDSLGNNTLIMTLDSHNKLCIDPAVGCAKKVNTFNSFGNIIKIQTFDNFDHLIVSRYGYATYLARYNDKQEFIGSTKLNSFGEVIEEDTNDVNKLSESENDYSKYYFKYDIYDVIIACIVLILSVFTFITAINAIGHKNIIDALIFLMINNILLTISYALSYKYLLYLKVLSPDVYNYSWILYLISITSCIILLICFIKVVDICKEKQYEWKMKTAIYHNIFKTLFHMIDIKTIFTIFIFAYVIGISIFFVDCMMDVYNEPL